MDGLADVTNKQKWLALSFVLPIAILLCSALSRHITAKPMLMNITPSEPQGIYRLTNDEPKKGSLITFMVPAIAHPFVKAHLTYLEKMPVLKEVIASAGDRVCARDQVLWVNGISIGNIASHIDRLSLASMARVPDAESRGVFRILR